MARVKKRSGNKAGEERVEEENHEQCADKKIGKKRVVKKKGKKRAGKKAGKQRADGETGEGVSEMGKAQDEPKPFRFLELSAEIRIEIYRLHLVHRRGKAHLVDYTSPFISQIPTPNLGVNLLRVCHQVHDEAVRILYGKNTFVITSRIRRPPGYLFWGETGESPTPTHKLERMGQKNRNMIESVEILIADSRHKFISRVAPLQAWLPNLKKRTFFLDCDGGSLIHDFPLDEGPLCEDYTILSMIMPLADQTFFNFSQAFMQDYECRDYIHMNLQWIRSLFSQQGNMD